MYCDLENIILHESQRSISRHDNEIPVTQKLTNIEITNDNMPFKDFI